MGGVSRVFHLAGIISILPGRNDLLRKVNVEGTKNILAAAKHSGVGRLIYTSSIHAIHRAPEGVRIDEAPALRSAKPRRRIRPIESGSLAGGAAGGAGWAGFGDRLPHRRDRAERLPPLGTRAVDPGLRRGKTQFYVDGAYDFVDVRDVADGMLSRGRKGPQRRNVHPFRPTAGSEEHHRYALGDDRQALHPHSHPVFPRQSRLGLHADLLPALGNKPRFTPYSLSTLRSNCNISHAKATRELGYHPRKLLETLADTVDWYRKNRRATASA